MNGDDTGWRLDYCSPFWRGLMYDKLAMGLGRYVWCRSLGAMEKCGTVMVVAYETVME